jgi:two-component system response regulator (stage 0 sporulation protein F)
MTDILMHTILVVDDEPMIRDTLQDLLEEEGYDVHVASNGASALLDILSNPPSLIILDGAMPVMSGEELLHELASNDTAQMPIIMLTAGQTPERYLPLGATVALSKPFDVDNLLDLLTDLLPPDTEQCVGG